MEKKNISLKILMIAIIVALGVKTYLLCIDDEKVTNQIDSYVQGTFYRQTPGKIRKLLVIYLFQRRIFKYWLRKLKIIHFTCSIM